MSIEQSQEMYREELAEKEKEKHKEFLEKHMKELEAQGWWRMGGVEKVDYMMEKNLETGASEEKGGARTKEDVEDEYFGNYEKDGFEQIQLLELEEDRAISESTKEVKDSFYVFMRTKEAAKEAQEKRKQIRKNLVVAIKPILEELGFKKDKKDTSTWQRVVGGVVQVFNLQTSYLGQEYFFNIGIYFKPLEEGKPLPKELDCQFRERLNYFIGGDEFQNYKDISSLTDFKSTKTVEEAQPKIDKIAEYLKNYVSPFFNQAISKESVEEYQKRKKEKNTK